VGKITIRTPNKGPNPTTMDKQITKEFFRIKLGEEVATRSQMDSTPSILWKQYHYQLHQPPFFFLGYYHGME